MSDNLSVNRSFVSNGSLVRLNNFCLPLSNFISLYCLLRIVFPSFASEVNLNISLKVQFRILSEVFFKIGIKLLLSMGLLVGTEDFHESNPKDSKMVANKSTALTRAVFVLLGFTTFGPDMMQGTVIPY